MQDLRNKHFRILDTIGEALTENVLLHEDFMDIPLSIRRHLLLIASYVQYKIGWWKFQEPEWGNVPDFFNIVSCEIDREKVAE